jgi:hypothetical protein
MRNLFLLWVCTASLSLAQTKVVKLESFSGKPASSSLGAVINQRHPGNITAYTASSIYLSTDSGRTWAPTKIPAAAEGQDFHLAGDPKGTLYYYYTLKDNDENIYFSKSTDYGVKWSETSSFNSGKGKDRYVSVTGHPRKDALMFTWTQSEEIEGLGCVSNLYAAISTSGGKKWGDPILINNASGDCAGKGNTIHAPNAMVARDGKVFVVWAVKEKIFIDRSFNGGGLWIRTDLPVGEQPGGWNLIVPDAGGELGMPSVAIDNTNYRTFGTLYIAYADQRNGTTDTDIWMIRSPNHGDNWTYPTRINLDEPGKYQYSPHLTVDQGTGFVYVAYFDRRNYDDARSDIYLAWSGDAGAKFSEIKINDSALEASEATPLLSVAAHKGVIIVLWTVTVAGETTLHASTLRQIDMK